jgi:hypothetical protein
MDSGTEQTRERRAGLGGPVILITLGVLLLLHEFVPDWGFGRTWPLLLIVFGVIKLLDANRPPRPPRGPQV